MAAPTAPVVKERAGSRERPSSRAAAEVVLACEFLLASKLRQATMMLRYSFGQVFGWAALLLWGSPLPAMAHEDCLQQMRTGVQPRAWETITNYFASLSPRAESPRSRLFQLRGQIVDFESQKENLIEIVDAYIAAQTSGMIASGDRTYSLIGETLEQLDDITLNLIQIAKEEDMFAAEAAFKKLVITIHAKRVSTLCELAQQAKSPTPDLSVLKTIVQQLKDELKAISAADDALGNYIKEGNK
jgi:hypothetical protein